VAKRKVEARDDVYPIDVWYYEKQYRGETRTLATIYKGKWDELQVFPVSPAKPGERARRRPLFGGVRALVELENADESDARYRRGRVIYVVPEEGVEKKDAPVFIVERKFDEDGPKTERVYYVDEENNKLVPVPVGRGEKEERVVTEDEKTVATWRVKRRTEWIEWKGKRVEIGRWDIPELEKVEYKYYEVEVEKDNRGYVVRGDVENSTRLKRELESRGYKYDRDARGWRKRGAGKDEVKRDLETIASVLPFKIVVRFDPSIAKARKEPA